MTAAEVVSDGPWEELVDSSPAPDVYFRPGYCRAWEAAGHGRAITVRTESALFPILLRELPFGETGYDAISPYGYGGVLPLTATPDLATDVRQFRDWCVTEGVASALLRLHPLVGGLESGLSGVDGVEVRGHGPTTAIELSQVTDGRLTGMSKGRKADLSVARRAVEIRWDPGGGALERFRDVYDETMRRIGASDYYLFPPEHYSALATGLGERLGVALAYAGDEVVGGALFMADRSWAHYHLSGTSEAGREHKAGTLLVHDGAVWAAERGCELLHLGGGTSGADSLYAFKRSFGGREHSYAFATLVADPSRYDALVARRAEEPEPVRPDFFPAYRA